MFNIIKPNTKFDFMGQTPQFAKLSVALFVGALLVIALKGLNLGLDFAGGYSILLEYNKPVTATEVRDQVKNLFAGVDTSVQSFELDQPGKTHYLIRILRSESLGNEEVTELEASFATTFGESFNKLRYQSEAGDVLEVLFTGSATTAATSPKTVKDLVEKTGHSVSFVRRIGRDDELRYSVVLVGVSAELVEGMKVLDPKVSALSTEFVGPTIGKQLRDDGLLAVLYALAIILVYVALRFDFYYSPGAIICLFHDAVITTAFLSLIGEQFTLATIAGLLTLVGYSINDTIVVFDRIRESVETTTERNLDRILNKAINDTLGRTLMTSITTLLACLALIVFGRGTVLASFGMIMSVGIVIGTYSSIYVASPMFKLLRERFAPDEQAIAARKAAQVTNPDKAVV
ncbi:MAG: protein translocase subunit SecF [Myxococcales bacterium]|nr:protein translocase subunit SecF [Myxococcales bacterium]